MQTNIYISLKLSFKKISRSKHGGLWEKELRAGVGGGQISTVILFRNFLNFLHILPFKNKQNYYIYKTK